ncbi:hypothetical protein [uncultured Roseibium sp.]|uniref:hypothetical protein n=1 Tax=uncultured Roseibium sp. TaxID=1936171 RepID=UPI0032181021
MSLTLTNSSGGRKETFIPRRSGAFFRLTRMARCETSPAIRGALRKALLEAGAKLVLLQQNPDGWFRQSGTEHDDLVNVHQFEEADRLRDARTEPGITLEDKDGHAEWRRMST